GFVIGVLAIVGNGLDGISFGFGAAIGGRGGGGAPVIDIIVEIRIEAHAGEPFQLVGGGRVEVEFGGFVDQAPERMVASDGSLIDIGVAANQPEVGVADFDILNVKINGVWQSVGGGEIGEDVADIDRRAFNGLAGLHAGDPIVRGTQLDGHRMREIQGDGRQAKSDPEDQNENRAVFSRGATRKLWQRRADHNAPPGVVRFVVTWISMGTMSSVELLCPNAKALSTYI